MPETLQRKERTARKPHICSYCGGLIENGEVYDWEKLACDGEIYEWKSHKKCSYIASELWSYIDPDDGMTAEDFQDGCRDFCQEFICQGCEQYIEESERCSKNKLYCIDRVYDFLQTYELHKNRRYGWFEVRKRREKT